MVLAFLLALGLPVLAGAQASAAPARPDKVRPPARLRRPPAPNLGKQPTLYVVGYAHLDTEWRWEYPQTIAEYLPKTMRSNFALFAKYPHYVFNFSGANRYRLMKEYYPADFQRLKQYVAAGRWFLAGSSMEESDVNSPSAESIFRQVLYGNSFFRRELGKASAEYMLPDCFGFPASLPSILAHSGLRGFSTQKLTWGSSAAVGGPESPERTPAGVPFNVGVWEGPDGKGVIAAFNPGSYGSTISTDLSKPLPPPAPAAGTAEDSPLRALEASQQDWATRVQRNGLVSGVYADYHYYGTGDVGGAPRESSVKILEAIVTRKEVPLPPPRRQGEQQQAQPPPSPPVLVGNGPVQIASATADEMFLHIKDAQMAHLPRYKGELELTNHSAGSLTSQAYQKRWNRQNELAADAAERASVAADWLGGRPYPRQRLGDAWTLVLGGQFHDIMAGTATPLSYEYSWNDSVLALNQFASVLTSATDAIVSGMNTQVKGKAIVVYNPLNIPRQDLVEADVAFSEGVPRGVRVYDPEGTEVPAQLAGNKDRPRVVFLAKVPAVGYAVYDLQAADAPASGTELKVSESTLENARYRITLDRNRDVASIFDKTLQKELLSSPMRLALQTEKPVDWPAWNMDWADQQKPPRAYVQGPWKSRVVEYGPARVAVEVERQTEGSKFVQTIRLAAGDAGNRVEVASAIDWMTKEAALKATFPLTAGNPRATYNWDVGTLERGNNHEKTFEVPSHQWFDLTNQDGSYGVTVLSDCKYGSDKPDDHTLRLTLIYTPGLGTGNGRAYNDQTSQDFGHHEFTYGLAGHAGDWRREQTDWQAQRLNQPLVAFESSAHAGALGKTFSLLRINSSRVRVLALKKAENGDETIVRLVELDGKPAPNVHLAFAAPIVAAREVNAQEMAIGPAPLARGELVTSFSAYQLRTFALKLGRAPGRVPVRVPAPRSRPVDLAYDISVSTFEGRPAQGCFDCLLENPAGPQGKALPAEMLPPFIDHAGVRFKLGPTSGGTPNAASARGQTVKLPAGKFNRLYLLAAAAGADQKATFRIGQTPVELTIQEWTGKIGQWDNRVWTNVRQETLPPRQGGPPRTRTVMDFSGKVTPGFIKRDEVAWYASHVHGADGNFQPYSFSYLFAYPVAVPAGATTLTLPDNPRIRILAISVADDGGRVRPVQPLYDTLDRTAAR
jgi:alpha-mannosidase